MGVMVEFTAASMKHFAPDLLPGNTKAKAYAYVAFTNSKPLKMAHTAGATTTVCPTAMATRDNHSLCSGTWFIGWNGHYRGFIFLFGG